jgi:alkylation response protein AidB-like acyl-CoA dehydrogenase
MRLREIIKDPIPLPGGGQTAKRHRKLMEIGRESVSLARLAEAHWDAVAILAEAAHQAEPNALYGVWASEIPGQSLTLTGEDCLYVSGSKKYCGGAGLIDHALVTIGNPKQLLIDIDLRNDRSAVQFDYSDWKAGAFKETLTATVSFKNVPVTKREIIGTEGWYLNRPGFWHGACGPAACWAGGAEGLVDYARLQHRDDPHTMAHLGAMTASTWALHCYLEAAGHEIDEVADTSAKAQILALTVRHLVEQGCSDILRRIPRAYGPHPLAMNEEVSRRYQEVDLYLRQSHAERDLESLGLASKIESYGKTSAREHSLPTSVMLNEPSSK